MRPIRAVCVCLVILTAGIAGYTCGAPAPAEPPPRPIWRDDGMFHKRIAGADRVVFRHDSDSILFEVTAANEIQELRDGIRFKSPQRVDVYFCHGYPLIEWYREGKKITEVSLIDTAVRWVEAEADLELTQSSGVWLAEFMAKRSNSPLLCRTGWPARQQRIAKAGHDRLAPLLPPGFLATRAAAEKAFVDQGVLESFINLSSMKSLEELWAREVRAKCADEKALHASLLRVLGALPMRWQFLYKPEQEQALNYLVRLPGDDLAKALASAAGGDDLLAKRGAARLMFSSAEATALRLGRLQRGPWVAMLAQLGYEDRFPENRMAVLEALKHYAEIPAIARLAEAVEDPNFCVRFAALEDLKARPETEARQVLEWVAAGKTRRRRPGPFPAVDYAEGLEPHAGGSVIWEPYYVEVMGQWEKEMARQALTELGRARQGPHNGPEDK